MEAWWFQVTRETETMSKEPGLPMTGKAVDLLQVIADLSRQPVIFDVNHRQGPYSLSFRIAAHTTVAEALIRLEQWASAFWSSASRGRLTSSWATRRNRGTPSALAAGSRISSPLTRPARAPWGHYEAPRPVRRRVD